MRVIRAVLCLMVSCWVSPVYALTCTDGCTVSGVCAAPPNNDYLPSSFVCTVDSSAKTVALSLTLGGPGSLGCAAAVMRLQFDAGDLGVTWQITQRLLNSTASHLWKVRNQLQIFKNGSYENPLLSDGTDFCYGCNPRTLDSTAFPTIFVDEDGVSEMEVDFEGVIDFFSPFCNDGCPVVGPPSCLTGGAGTCVNSVCCDAGPATGILEIGMTEVETYPIVSDSFTDVLILICDLDCCSNHPLGTGTCGAEDLTCPNVGGWAWTHRP